MEILVTGGMGYIGSHTCVQMLLEGMQPIILDNLCNSSKEVLIRIEIITGYRPIFYYGDIRDEKLLDNIFTKHYIKAVIHFAGLKSINESVNKPLEYYDNNVYGTLMLIRSMYKANIKNIIFSSSATVYGNPEKVPITEDFKIGNTKHPYGRNKYIIERYLSNIQHLDNSWSVTLLRYFNPIGAYPSGIIGEDSHYEPNNLIPYISQVAIGRKKKLIIFGNDYPTSDGTGIRDYIHVMDVADGNIMALKSISLKPGLHIYNLGSGRGTSVLEILKIFEKICNKKIAYEIRSRRPGDIAECWSNPIKAKSDFGWTAKHSIETMLVDTWRWQCKNPYGYKQLLDKFNLNI
ncbi:UDP-glucose 4-epimerase [Candidatus Arsenophonus lipoptenae]|uniref:UDP-glucose 4-epimerase n=1 Tax=Candidatus Arsenophonus lipoptenae TaxID=634113 RepID=A0A0X9VR27_9GAMM|nr:UDP-glucose 4-epimerase GalE [Candidatus Arsenophonus lipoptenae]AMA64697.1 UDP-glucose 4-epimerase [Candidatus Arsenophonus lipoptenae]